MAKKKKKYDNEIDFGPIRINWQKLRYFYLVSLYESLSLTADRINISQSCLSRHIASLEESLGKVKLFERNVTGLAHTEAGTILFNEIKDVFPKILNAEYKILQFQQKKQEGKAESSVL